MRRIFTATILLCAVFLVHAKKKKKYQEHLHEAPDSERGSICYVNIRNLPVDHPLFIYPNTTDLIYPNRPFLHIYLTKHEEVELHCPGQQLFLGESLIKEFRTMSCVGGLMFEDDVGVYNIETIECTGMIKTTVVRTGTSCYPAGEYLKIGFSLTDGRFSNVYTVCFDFKKRTTHNTYNVVNEWANWSNLSASSNMWEGPFFNCSARLSTLYSRDIQRESYRWLSEDTIHAVRFINPTSHLLKHRIVPIDDFVYKAERTATNWYLNVVPLWSHLKIFNWATVQRFIRRYASTRRVSLEVYSGTHGIMQIYNPQYGNIVDFYLKPDGIGIPVPLFIWKVVYDRKYKAGIVFIGLNNAHYRQLPSACHICKDISHELGPAFPVGNNTRQYNYERGYIYACTIEDFRQHYPFLPEFDVRKVFEII